MSPLPPLIANTKLGVNTTHSSRTSQRGLLTRQQKPFVFVIKKKKIHPAVVAFASDPNHALLCAFILPRYPFPCCLAPFLNNLLSSFTPATHSLPRRSIHQCALLSSIHYVYHWESLTFRPRCFPHFLLFAQMSVINLRQRAVGLHVPHTHHKQLFVAPPSLHLHPPNERQCKLTHTSPLHLPGDRASHSSVCKLEVDCETLGPFLELFDSSAWKMEARIGSEWGSKYFSQCQSWVKKASSVPSS